MGLVTSMRARQHGFWLVAAVSAHRTRAGVLLLAGRCREPCHCQRFWIAFLMAEGVVSIFYATEHARDFRPAGLDAGERPPDLVLAVISWPACRDGGCGHSACCSV